MKKNNYTGEELYKQRIIDCEKIKTFECLTKRENQIKNEIVRTLFKKWMQLTNEITLDSEKGGKERERVKNKRK